MKPNKTIKDLKKAITADFGKPCKTYSAMCVVCLVWRAFETLDCLYEKKAHLTDWELEKKK